MAKTFTLTIRIDDDKKDSVTTSKDLVLALVDCASRLDHGDSDVLKPNGISTCYANGLQVGKYEITANPEPPIILPTPTKTTVIAAGSLRPGNIVVDGHGYASWKVGSGAVSFPQRSGLAIGVLRRPRLGGGCVK